MQVTWRATKQDEKYLRAEINKSLHKQFPKLYRELPANLYLANYVYKTKTMRETKMKTLFYFIRVDKASEPGFIMSH